AERVVVAVLHERHRAVHRRHLEARTGARRIGGGGAAEEQGRREERAPEVEDGPCSHARDGSPAGGRGRQQLSAMICQQACANSRYASRSRGAGSTFTASRCSAKSERSAPWISVLVSTQRNSSTPAVTCSRRSVGTSPSLCSPERRREIVVAMRSAWSGQRSSARRKVPPMSRSTSCATFVTRGRCTRSSCSATIARYSSESSLRTSSLTICADS